MNSDWKVGFFLRQVSIHPRVSSLRPFGPSLYHIFAGTAVADGVSADKDEGGRGGVVVGAAVTVTPFELLGPSILSLKMKMTHKIMSTAELNNLYSEPCFTSTMAS